MLGDVTEWEESDEVVTHGSLTFPRYSSLETLIRQLTVEGHAFDYSLCNSLLLCLPSFSTPQEMFSLLFSRYMAMEREESESVDGNSRSGIRAQIQLKVLLVLRCWARNPCAHVDLSGSVLVEMS